MSLTSRDPNQIVQYEHEQKDNAKRVYVVNDFGISDTIKESLKNLKVDFTPQVHDTHPVPAQVQAEIQYIDRPYIVKEVVVEQVEIPMIVERQVIREVQVPVIQTQIEYVDKPIIVKEFEKIEIPVIVKEQVLVKDLSVRYLLMLNAGLLFVMIVSQFLKH